MSNFERELQALIEDWIKRGDDPASMIEALRLAVVLMDARITQESEKTH